MSGLRGLFNKQHGKRAKPLFESVCQQLYYIDWSLLTQLSWKKLLFLRCQVLGLLVNTVGANEKNPVLNRENLMIPIQMQLSRTQKTFSEFFAKFLKPKINFKDVKKNITLIDFVFPKLPATKTRSDKCLKSRVSENPSTSNMVNVPQHCWNLHHSAFIISNDHFPVN